MTLAVRASVLAGQAAPRDVAAIVTEHCRNSHADLFVSRPPLTDTLDGTGRESPFRLASVCTEEQPPNDP
jgi:hypothetical protein